jgi:hypothetical protein
VSAGLLGQVLEAHDGWTLVWIELDALAIQKG